MTTFNYEINYHNQSSVCSGDATINGCLKKMVHDLEYYRSLGYSKMKVTITEICPTCYNTGSVGKYKGVIQVSVKKCPECKGKPPKNVIKFTTD